MLPELQAFDRAEELPEPPDPASATELAKYSDNLVTALVMAYDREIAELIENYRQVVKISPTLLKELNVDKQHILSGVRRKIEGLKDKYWSLLFDKLKTVTKRMATKQRNTFLASLKGKAAVDFTEGNIYAMLVWITKWANDYFDEQLIDMFKTLSERCNVVNYKSNDKVWTKGEWRYNDEDKHTYYKLEYRLVLERAGGISSSEYSWESTKGLENRAMEFLMDCITVANNLGYDCEDRPINYEWRSNKQNVLKLSDGNQLLAVRAFKNKNMHLHWNSRVMLAINVEAGRLLGWIRTPEEAVREMAATKEEEEIIHQVFGSSLRIGSNLLRLT
jgi:hypothetical protein